MCYIKKIIGRPYLNRVPARNGHMESSKIYPVVITHIIQRTFATNSNHVFSKRENVCINRYEECLKIFFSLKFPSMGERH